MRFLQSEPDVPLAEQSVVATRRGVPWWGAVAIAFGVALLGIAIDSAAARLLHLSDGLHARQICFALGALLAALAVRNKALFTAAVQPPLIAVGLVIARVIGVQIKGLVTSANVPELSSLLIKQIFAFSNDFPVILFTFLAVLTVVLVRWWRYRTARKAAAPGPDKSETADAAKARTAGGKSTAASKSAPAAPKPESAAARASRAAAQARTNPKGQPPANPGLRAAPAVVPSGRPRPPAPRSGEPAVRPRSDRMTAGTAARGIRLDDPQRTQAPSNRPPAVRPAPPAVPPQPAHRRAAPPPLDDDGF